MEEIEQYILLVTDTFFANIAILNSDEMVIWALYKFGNDKLILLGGATLGFTFAVIFNYLFGILLYRIYLSIKDDYLEKRYQAISKITNLRLFIYILCTSIPVIGRFIPLFFGFISLPVSKLSYIIALRAVYYVLILYLTNYSLLG